MRQKENGIRRGVMIGLLALGVFSAPVFGGETEAESSASFWGNTGGETEAESSASFEGNLLKITTASDFDAGICQGLILDEEIGDGALLLKDGRLKGSFESAVYECSRFNQINACWNAAVYEGGAVEVFARARHDGIWTEYLTWGVFTPCNTRGTRENKTDESAIVDQDTFCMSEDLEADAIQVKVEIRRDSRKDRSPVLRMVSMTFRGGEMVPLYVEEPVSEIPDRVLIEAPAVSQMIRSPKVSADICSPTSMTVMMNSRVPELNLLPEEYAVNVKDEEEDIFGSWSFSVAGAGLYGFEAYTQFGDFDIVMQELAKGHTVGMNVRYSNDPEDPDVPYMEGVFDRTTGHLICLIGYEYEDGIRDDDHLYFYSSDSFAYSDQTAYRRYKASQLKECFGGILYLIPDDSREVTKDYASGVVRVDAELTKDPERDDTWILTADGNAVDMDRFINGNGILACSVQTKEKAGPVQTDHSIIYEKAVFTEANQPFCYDIILRRDGSLVLDRQILMRKLDVEDEGQDLLLYAISDRGVCYKAVF